MADDAVTVLFFDVEAEGVAGALAVLQLDLLIHFLVAFRGEHGLGEQGNIPEGQIVGSHGQLAGREHPAAAFTRRGAQRTQGVAIVALGIGCGQLDLVRVPDRMHAQRTEDALGEQIHERMAGDVLDDLAGQNIVGVRILPLGAGLEVERLFGPGVENVLRGGGGLHRGHGVVLGVVVLIAGGVGEDLADGDLIAAGEAGKVFTHRIVELELALLLEHEQGGGGELLGDGADRVAHLGRGREGRATGGGQPRRAVGVGVNQLAVLDNRQRG